MINSSGQLHKMKCPNMNCKLKIESEEVKQLLNGDAFQKFYRLMKNHEIATSRDKKFCPYPGCEGVVQKQVEKKALCPDCKRFMCYSC